ncbi:MAG: arsenate reductase ArsC [Spirochaetes bacterium]|nr:arsenate reductase ArsC [Spirochaetota bacterium]
MTKAKLKILFLCTGNSCRSQMAEGLARALCGNAVEARSAGTAPKGIDPRAVTAMAEIGIDISGQRSRHVSEFTGIEFDYVVTLCGGAAETCPVFPGKTKVVHVGFEDPPELAKGAASEGEALAHYRRVRDEIRAFVEGLPDSLEERMGQFSLN